MHTIPPCAEAILYTQKRKKCTFEGDITIKDKYLYVGSQGGSVLIPNVVFGCGHIPNNIFSAGISLDQNTSRDRLKLEKTVLLENC
jgi:hypothetical protein